MAGRGSGGDVRLIINADDFGWSEGVNEAVCRLYDDGILTSTSLMVGTPAVADAVARWRERPGLAVGLHMVLVSGPALLPAEQIPHIVDERGWFPDRDQIPAWRYTFSRPCREEMARELAAQFAAFAAYGIPWSHVDSHRHLSLVPAFFREAVRLAKQYDAVGFRIPEDNWPLYRRMEPEGPPQLDLAAWFAALCAGQRRALRNGPFVTTRRCYGLFRTGRLDADYLCRLVQEIPAGDYELHCHPDLSTESGRGEFEALRSPAFRQALEAQDVTLATYATLRAGRAAARGQPGRLDGSLTGV